MATRYLADHAVYQGSLTVADYKRAGFHIVNHKTSHGVTLHGVRAPVAAEIRQTRQAGMGVSTFHWLIGGVPGAAQARYAYARLVEAGAHTGAAHVVDVEEQDDADPEPPPTLQDLVDYIREMRRLRPLPVMLYTGDWWWTGPGRNWNGAALTPYLHATPNDGYLTAYPGDASPHWSTKRAPTPGGYGGWAVLSAMQYAVEPLFFPDGTQGTIKVSKTAIRDDKVWQALTGGDHFVTSQTEFNTYMTAWWAVNAGPGLAKMLQAVDAVLANVRADDNDVAALRQEIQAAARTIEAGVDADIQAAAKSVVSGLAAAVTDTDDLAALLAAALGDRAPEVGAALQAGGPS